MKKTIFMATLSVAGALMVVGTAHAQAAGTTAKVDMVTTDTTQPAAGWSVHKSILGKVLYNDAGEKIGTIEDVIIAPDRKISFLIVRAGGFIGIGRHDVAIPFSQIMEKGDKLTLPGATKETIKAMQQFDYASGSTKYDQFIAKTDLDLAKTKELAADLQKKSSSATGEAKLKLDKQITILQQDVKSAEDKLAEMKRAGAKRWKEFESAVNKTMAKMKQSLDDAGK